MMWYVATPTAAEIALPPITDHGCANGLEGTANTSTADAPSGATIDGNPGACGAYMQSAAVKLRQTSAPRQAMTRSENVPPARIG